VTVTDVLLQTVLTLVNLGGRRLGLGGTEGEKDLEQARLAIDATRALVDLLPPDQTAPIKDALSQLQMAYAREARASPQSPEGRQGEDAGEAERARARSKLWTPPGT
jgi:hypothetical protein